MEFKADDIIERIKSITSIKELEKIGISQATVSNWKTRNTIPKSDDLYKISQFCGCSMEYLLTGHKIDDDNIYLTREQQLIVNATKQMDPEHIKLIVNMAEALTGK